MHTKRSVKLPSFRQFHVLSLQYLIFEMVVGLRFAGPCDSNPYPLSVPKKSQSQKNRCVFKSRSTESQVLPQKSQRNRQKNRRRNRRRIASDFFGPRKRNRSVSAFSNRSVFGTLSVSESHLHRAILATKAPSNYPKEGHPNYLTKCLNRCARHNSFSPP